MSTDVLDPPDTGVPVAPAPAEPQPPVELDDGLVPCPECDGRFVKGPGLSRHIRLTHPEAVVGDFVCDNCGHRYKTKDTLRKHLRSVHGPGSRSTGRPGRPKRTLDVAEASIEPRPVRSPLTSSEITRAAALHLWPKGIPHDKLPALLRWHQQTAEFLEEVQ